jgi:hypothetical protein
MEEWRKLHIKEVHNLYSTSVSSIDRHERKIISELYIAQNVKVQLDQGKTRCVKTEREVRQDCCLS